MEHIDLTNLFIKLKNSDETQQFEVKQTVLENLIKTFPKNSDLIQQDFNRLWEDIQKSIKEAK